MELLQKAIDSVIAGEAEASMDEQRASDQVNKRGGYTKKKLRSEFGTFDIRTPLDRNGLFNPTLIPKGQRTLNTGFEE